MLLRCAVVLPLLAASLTLWRAVAHANDWPQWGGTDARNMVSPEDGLPETFEPGKKSPNGGGIDPATTRNVRWTARLGTQTYGNPTVADGRVYIGTNDEDLDDPRYESTRGGVVKCLDEATGRLVWQLVVPRRTDVPPQMLLDHLSLGVCSSPTVDGDRVYLVTNRGEVVCLDVHGMANGNDGPFLDEAHFSAPPGKPPVPPGPNDADIIWRLDMVSELGVFPQDATNCSVLVHGDAVYVCTGNGVDKSHDKVPVPLAPSLVALEKKAGRLVAMDDEKIGTRLFHGQWSSPSLGVIDGKTLIFFGAGDGLCYAFEAVSPL